MIPVYQQHFGWGEGDCTWACLASIFEEPLESFAYSKVMALSDGDLMKLTEQRWPHLEYVHADLATNYRIVDGPYDVPGVGSQRWAYDLPRPDKWAPPLCGATDYFYLGSVHSQKLMHPVESPYYGMPGLHSVVMHGREVAHDPNPNNDPYGEPLPIVGIGFWVQRG